MRARNIKPGFFKNDSLAELSIAARILFIGLWCMADREGRLEDRPKRIKAEVLPYESCNVEKLLDELDSAQFIRRYTDKEDKNNYIDIPNFSKHQSPHKNEKHSEIPPFMESHENSRKTPEDSHENPPDCGMRNDDSLNDERSTPPTPPKGGGRQKFIPPTLEQVKEYCRERDNGVDPHKWFDHYTAKGWMVGKNKMVDWRAAVRTWEKENKEDRWERIFRKAGVE